MPTAPADMSVLEPATAVAELGDRIARTLGDAGPVQPRLVRVQVPVAAPDPSVWLAAQAPGNRLYWSDRDRTFAAAGIGGALTLSLSDPGEPRALFDRVRLLLSDSPTDTRFYCGFRFDNTRPIAPHWQPFAFGQFILPRFELVARDGSAMLAANLVLPDDYDRVEDILSELSRLIFTPARPHADLAGIRRRTDNPERDLWMARVQEAVDSIQRGEMDKIVLARESRFELEHPVDPSALIRQLQAVAPHCFIFCFELSEHTAFLGATPERLYRRVGRAIQSEALAGTRPRGGNQEEDERLGDKLLSSRKESREHAFVADAIRAVLADLCKDLRGGDTRSLVKLARVQHMATRFEGELLESATDTDLLAGLHPTPAVGGVPTATAQAVIRDLETFDRGWYAGPVGWISRDSAEFAVGIRSALVEHDTLRLFSGAGIVDGSHPDREWDEIENKIAGFLKLLAAL